MIEIVLKSAIWLGVGALLAQRVAKTRPAAAHLIWVALFAGAILIPALSSISPKAHLSIPLGPSTREIAQVPPELESSTPASPASTTPAIHPGPQVEPAQILMALWVVGALLVVSRYAWAWHSINQIKRRQSTRPRLGINPHEFAQRIGVSQPWEVRQSTSPYILTAMTWGLLRPVVLLPRDADGWPVERLEAVLLHEFAHVRRRDFASQLLAEAVCALYWFNPLAWFGARAMREVAESAADDAVVRSGVKASDYAAQLLQLAAEIGNRSRAFAQVGVSVMSQPKIESRLRSVLSPSARNRGMTSVQAVAICALISLSIASMAALKVSGSSQSQDEAQEALQRVKHLALAIHIYANDYDDRLPYAVNSASAKSVIKPYVKDLIDFRSPTRGARIEFNLNLGGVQMKDVRDPQDVPLWIEWLPNGAASAVSFLDGHARLLDQRDHKPLLRALSATYPRDAKPFPKTYLPNGKVD